MERDSGRSGGTPPRLVGFTASSTFLTGGLTVPRPRVRCLGSSDLRRCSNRRRVFFRPLRNHGLRPVSASTLATVAALCSWPFLFAVQRGNIELLLWLALVAAL